ncbi:MAG: hypothetical protein A3E87_08405 [Gammaproteobacteria bacterium RIFCSPHIGHO2_12_FULL_35_23]|nr:MAG: hypothetical protein A3E87_08405 [Gammaproteobacteria bacterium RIFCSPHIGHO2_12_FULL_35_23]
MNRFNINDSLQKEIEQAIHDISTPLATIKMGIIFASNYLQNEQDNKLDPSDIKKALHNALTSTETISSLLRDLRTKINK